MITTICEICITKYLEKLIELERYAPAWKDLETIEVLLFIGEPKTEENIMYMEMAREKFESISLKFT